MHVENKNNILKNMDSEKNISCLIFFIVDSLTKHTPQKI